MGLIIFKDFNNIKRPDCRRYYGSEHDVQYEYCTEIEYERLYDTKIIFDKPEVKEYLEIFGIRYMGDYTLESDDCWDMSVWESKQFVTFMNPELQLACLILSDSKSTPVLCEETPFSFKYMQPVLKQRDVYLEVGTYIDLFPYISLAKKYGVELEIAGYDSEIINNMTYKEAVGYADQIEHEYKYLTREIDRKYFPEEEFRPYPADKIKLNEYVKNIIEGKVEKERDEEILENNPKLKEVYVQINGINRFNGNMRRYPIHCLFYKGGEWKHKRNLTFKWPSFIELLTEAVLEPGLYSDGLHECVDISDVEQMFALVLDCDEVCDVTEYWKKVCMIVKYDTKEKLLEICDEKKGLWEFHELFQKSTDL